MNLSEEFRRHAKECKRMARSVRDSEEKATWSQMAERWLVCAERTGSGEVATKDRAERAHA